MGFLDSKIKTFENGKQVIEMPNSVNFLIVTSDDKVMLSKQWRASSGKETINLFGGYIDEGEGIINAAQREMFEETNVDFTSIRAYDIVYIDKLVSAGYTTERNTLIVFYSTLSSVELQRFAKCNDESENIIIEYIPLKEAKSMNFDGIKTTLAIAYAKRRSLWSKFLEMLGK